jgi:predicted  nucleic acid-binding Zn-ribbon protein
MIARCLLVIALLAGPSIGLAQRQGDPLTPAEIDQLRDSAVDPDVRLKLYVQFARTRLLELEQMRGDPKATERAQKTHSILESFLAIYDELNDNIDNFEARKNDLRKALKPVIEGDTEFQAKLRALRDEANAKPEEAKQYEFVLSNSIETVDSSAQDHKQLLADQEEAFKHKKKSKD